MSGTYCAIDINAADHLCLVWSHIQRHTDVTRMSHGCHTDVILTFSNWLMELIDAYGNAYGNNLR